MDKDCDIVKDLMINYVENNLRDNSKIFVEEHLKECKECTDYLKIVEEDVVEINDEKDLKEINVFKKINEKMKSKRKLVKVLAVFMFLIIIFNVGIFVNYEFFMSNAGMEVFLKEDISDENKEKIKQCIKNFEIKEYSFKSKEDALELMKEKMGENAVLLNGYKGENNIFPVSYKITLTELEYSEEVEMNVLTYEVDSKKGIIDLSGNKLTEAIYDDIKSLESRPGRLLVKKDNKLYIRYKIK